MPAQRPGGGTPDENDPEVPWLVTFADRGRLLVVAKGLPMLLLIQGKEVGLAPLQVSSPPLREAHLHQASGTLGLYDGPAPHGYTLAAAAELVSVP